MFLFVLKFLILLWAAVPLATILVSGPGGLWQLCGSTLRNVGKTVDHLDDTNEAPYAHPAF